MNLVKLQVTKLTHRNLLHYTNNKISEREIQETTPITMASKRVKYLVINLPLETKDLYSENSDTLMKEIKDNRDGKLYLALALKDGYCQNDCTTLSNLQI